jgi:TRAP-type C4-dicarboxylate transport system substrate-binding protein
MKKSFSLVSILVILVLSNGILIAACNTPSGTTTQPTQPTQKQIVLRATMAQPPMDAVDTETIKMAERYNARAGGQYKIEVYPGEQLAKYPESLDIVKSGLVEMANTGWGYFSNTLPILRAAETPFLFNCPESNAAVAAVLPGLYYAECQKIFNQKPLADFNVKPIELVSNKPIKVLADWKGITMAGATYHGPELVKVLDATPVFVPYPDFYTLIQKGVVDAMQDASAFTYISKIYEVAKYQTLFCGLGSSHGFTINLDVWNKMPKNVQDILV